MEGSFVIAIKKKNTGGIKMKAHDLIREIESSLENLATLTEEARTSEEVLAYLHLASRKRPKQKRMAKGRRKKSSRSSELSMSLMSARPKVRNYQKPLLLQTAVMRGFFLFWRKLSKIVVSRSATKHS
jgi:hypothetical protein